MQYNKLGDTGMVLSHVGLGGAAFSSIYGKFEEEKSIDLIRESLKHINYLETGPWYGQGTSERTIGKALKRVPRGSYYIGSKVGRYETVTKEMFDFSSEKTAFSVDNTLELLGLDYVDIIQVHDVTFAPDISIILKETLPALAKAVDEGKAKYIGIADYDLDLMKEIVEESEIRISTILSYAKSTLIDNRLQKYIKFFKGKGIGVINAAATGMGLLTNSGPQEWHPASDEIKELCKRAADYCKEKDVELAHLATYYTLHQPGIDTNVCGFTNLRQLCDTLHILKKGLTERETGVLKEIQRRFFNKGILHWDDVELLKYKAAMSNDSSSDQ